MPSVKHVEGNPIVALLGGYGPSAASDAAVDENVQRALRRHGVAPIVIPAPRMQAIRDALLGAAPANVILTGTAGDGKTYHIRRFLFDHTDFPASSWPGSGLLEAKLPSGRTLRVIRDLSQLQEKSKAALIGSITSSFLGDADCDLYLMAANDGQLLKFWREAAGKGATDGSARKAHRGILDALTGMLQHNLEHDPDGKLKVALLNLSRAATGATLDQVMQGILHHPAWGTGCDACAVGPDKVGDCAIRRNRGVLMGDGTAPTFRGRLQEVVGLAAMNDQHIPVRQMLMLGANILLGDTKRADRPLLDCAEARRRGPQDAHLSNPFNNAVGLNVRNEKRRAITVFSVMETFGIGYETDNAVDALLMEGAMNGTGAALETRDPHYGQAVFRSALDGYNRGDIGPERFNAKLETQRRRLFFLLGEGAPHAPSPWRLTIFHHAGEYLELCAAGPLPEKDQARTNMIDQLLRKLLRGLNRTLTGMMTDDTDALWLARTIGRADGAPGRFTTLSAIKRRPAGEPFRIGVTFDRVLGRPQIRVLHRNGTVSEPSLPLDLRPLMFEYLMRVSGGSLPSSFSRQCQQEVRHFSLSATAFVEARLHEEDGEGRPVQILSVGRDGRINFNPIGN